MQNLEMLAKLHDAMKRVYHLSVLRTTTLCLVEKMYGEIPMPEFLESLRSDLFELYKLGADNVLKEVKAQGELEFYLHAINFMSEPEYTHLSLLPHIYRMSETDFKKIEQELFKYN